MKNITQALKVIALALTLSFGISYVYAWTAPIVTPPVGNVSAPINTSSTAQYKEGALGIGGLLRGYANAIFDGSVGVGTTNPSSKLHVNGNPQTTNALLRVSTNDDNNGPARNILDWGYVPGVLISNDWDGDAATSNSTKVAKLVLNTASGGYNSGGSIHVEGAGGYDQGQLVFSTGWDSSNNGTERMRINASGNVGVGVSNPTQKLDVAGNIKGTGLCIGTDCKTSWPTGGVTPPAGSEFLDTSATAQTKAGDIKVSGSIGIGLGASSPAQKLDVAGSAQITGTIFGGGAQTTYGATTIRGDKNGWSGINFAASSGANNGTLMMHPSYSGFYNATDNGWRMYVTDPGNVYANDYYSNASGKWASSAQTRVTGSCAVGQAITAINADGTVTCGTAGGQGLGVGQTWQNVTASRACGVGYTNSTGKPIMANIYVGNTAAQQFPFFNAYVDGVLVATFNLRSWGANGGSNVGSSVNFVVPNGSSYNCARSGDAAVYSWTELR